MKKSVRHTKKQRNKFPLSADAVQRIADMQRDLDAYNFATTNIIGFLKGKFGNHKPAIRKGIAATDEVNDNIDFICSAAFDADKEIRKLKEKLKQYES